jgi:hypothetical protein
MGNLKFYLGLGKCQNKFAKLYVDHFVQSLAGLKYIQTLRKPTDQTMNSLKLHCAKLTNQQIRCKKSLIFFSAKKTLIFDLDETLIHVSQTTKDSNFRIPIKLKTGKVVKVKKIP